MNDPGTLDWPWDPALALHFRLAVLTLWTGPGILGLALAPLDWLLHFGLAMTPWTGPGTLDWPWHLGLSLVVWIGPWHLGLALARFSITIRLAWPIFRLVFDWPGPFFD